MIGGKIRSNAVVVDIGVPPIDLLSALEVDMCSVRDDAAASRHGDESFKLLLMEGTLIISGT